MFYWPFGIFISSGRASFLVLSAPWHVGSPPGPRTQVWALAEVRDTCSGGQSAVEPVSYTHLPVSDIYTRYILLCINVFLWHIGIFFSSGRGSFLVLSAPWHAGSPREHQGASVGPGRHPWHVLWGFKVASPHGEAFRARRAIQATENHVHVKRMSAGSCDIWDLECHQCRQT